MIKIYKITNLVNNKIYIGVTQRSIQKRFKEHRINGNEYLKPDIEKYGMTSFFIEQIDEAIDREDAHKKESEYIKIFQSQNPEIGYNISSGIISASHAFESKVKLIESIKQSKKNKTIKRYENLCEYVGVYHCAREWAYSIHIVDVSGEKKICERNFNSAYDAAIVRDAIIAKHFSKEISLKLMNFPEKYQEFIDNTTQLPKRCMKIENKKSNYLWVCFNKKWNSWRARVTKYGNTLFTKSSYETEMDAAIVADYYIILNNLDVPLNFPEKLEEYKDSHFILPKTGIEKRKIVNHKNISIEKTGNKVYFRVHVRIDGKQYRPFLKTLEEAIEKRNEILTSIGRPIPD